MADSNADSSADSSTIGVWVWALSNCLPTLHNRQPTFRSCQTVQLKRVVRLSILNMFNILSPIESPRRESADSRRRIVCRYSGYGPLDYVHNYMLDLDAIYRFIRGHQCNCRCIFFFSVILCVQHSSLVEILRPLLAIMTHSIDPYGPQIESSGREDAPWNGH